MTKQRTTVEQQPARKPYFFRRYGGLFGLGPTFDLIAMFAISIGLLVIVERIGWLDL